MEAGSVAIMAPHGGAKNQLEGSSDIWGLLRTFICGSRTSSKMAALRRLIGLVPGMVQCARQGGRTNQNKNLCLS